VRPNRDTLYSGAVFDYDAGPVTITLPDAGNRFMSMQVIDEDEYTHAVDYGAGRYTMTRDEMGTRYGSLVIRILANPQDPEDMKPWAKAEGERTKGVVDDGMDLGGSPSAGATDRLYCALNARAGRRRTDS
jgi:hypothetical protein